MRFYVYLTNDKYVDFIEDEQIERFAQQFDPTKYTFSGVAIDAEDIDAAHRTWNSPSCSDGTYMMADQPIQTIMRSASSSAANLGKQLTAIQSALRIKIAAMKLREVSETMNQVAKNIYEAWGSTANSSAQKIFNELSKQIIDASIKYNGDTKESG